LSFDYEETDSDETDHGSLAYQTRIPSSENDILFNIDFGKFRKCLTKIERELLDWLVYGLNPKEISRMMLLKYNDVRARLKTIGQKFSEFFQYKEALHGLR